MNVSLSRIPRNRKSIKVIFCTCKNQIIYHHQYRCLVHICCSISSFILSKSIIKLVILYFPLDVVLPPADHTSIFLHIPNDANFPIPFLPMTGRFLFQVSVFPHCILFTSTLRSEPTLR